MITRRRFLTATAGGAFAAAMFGIRTARAQVPIAFPTLDPVTIPKYAMPLIIPPAMPQSQPPVGISFSEDTDYYEIAVRQFTQQILPPIYPRTTVWSYGSANHGDTFNYPAFTIEAQHGRPVWVKWINDLGTRPHLLPVDQTLHWANPPGPPDSRTSRTAPYTGPVPIVTHVHGAHTTQDSDGYPEAWFLSAAAGNSEYVPVGSKYGQFAAEFLSRTGVAWESGTATFAYPNDQRATTLWYHDHTLGMTRLNVYAGPAGFYLIRGDTDADDLPPGILPAGPYEVPIAIQDRSFNLDGSLFYPDSRAFFDGFLGPYIPGSDVSPIWNPEFFGNAMVVNGRTWPVLNVEPRRYRFRLLNGCNSRTLILKLVTNPVAKRPAAPVLPFWQIGAEGGFLRAPVQLPQLLMTLAERADVVVDFTGLPVGTQVFLINEGPDIPFNGGNQPPANPLTTGQVMAFQVVQGNGPDTSTAPAGLSLPAITPLTATTNVPRQVSLNEMMSMVLPRVGPVAALLGTVMSDPKTGKVMGMPMMWTDPMGISETPAQGSTEVWEIFNFTVDAHPIHLHQTQFQVVNRQRFNTGRGASGKARPPEPWETGFKDTVLAYPGEITRIMAPFDIAGLFVWHCHIVEHEDNEMMRPLLVV